MNGEGAEGASGGGKAFVGLAAGVKDRALCSEPSCLLPSFSYTLASNFLHAFT